MCIGGWLIRELGCMVRAWYNRCWCPVQSVVLPPLPSSEDGTTAQKLRIWHWMVDAA